MLSVFIKLYLKFVKKSKLHKNIVVVNQLNHIN